MIIIKNWGIVNKNPYQAPETQTCHLNGEVYGHPEFADGTSISTSAITNIIKMDDHKEIHTLNSIYIVHPEDIYPDYEAQFPGAYERFEWLGEI